jgi:hypothetical protein
MRNLIRTTLRAVARRLQRWQQARAFRQEWAYHAQQIQSPSRHTWE